MSNRAHALARVHEGGIIERVDAEPDFEPDIYIDPQQLAGVWANWFDVTYHRHEFTLDFAHIDHRPESSRQGILVARVACSHGLFREFIDLMERKWASYAEESMPREVRGDGELEDHRD